MPAVATWDFELGFVLYSIGLSQQEIAQKFKVANSTVCERAKTDKWEERKQIVLTERAIRVGSSVSNEQQFIRSQECDMARRLLGLAHEMIRTLVRSPKTDVADLCRVLELSSTLARRGTGMPLAAMELTVQHDLSQEIKDALNKVYGPETAIAEAKPVLELESAQPVEPQGNT